jgi:murein DD-endopeptidase MepM/ murein hydrolase activator NlpD
MPRLTVPSQSRNWPRLAILAVVGVTAAGCADSARFDSNPYASNRRSAPQQDVTGSISSRPIHRVETQTLPAPTPTRPYSVPAGVASGAQGLGAYRPGTRAPEYTGSVPEQRVAAAPAKPSGHWTWNGGTPVVVGRGESLEAIARKYGVPAQAILETNGIRSAAGIHAGERLVIPRYVVGEAQVQTPHVAAPRIEPARVEPARHAAMPASAHAGVAATDVHIVQPGESLIGIARRYNMTLAEIARANAIQPYTKVNIGDRIKVPARGAGERVAMRQPAPVSAPAAAPRRVAQAAPPIENVGSVPTENARMATPEPVAPAAANPVKKAEAVAANTMPTFRWPVTGHVIEAFGPRPNGTTNDGINLAVPEGTPIKAAEDGVVAYAGNELKGYGNLVLIRHADNFVSAYANASEIMVKRGDTVKRGQEIARAGQTGTVSSPQLHFEIRKGSTPVDPRKYLASN